MLVRENSLSPAGELVFAPVARTDGLEIERSLAGTEQNLRQKGKPNVLQLQPRRSGSV
jgi:hypothetical protein